MSRFSAVDLSALLGRPAPTPEQQAIIESPLAPALVVAGAGSGKTETMASRVVWLVANDHVTPGDVLGLTFTRKAAAELGERIRTRLLALAEALRRSGAAVPVGLDAAADLAAAPLRVSTYNGFAADLVSREALRLGLDTDLTVLSASASWEIAHGIVTGWDAPLETTKSPTTVTKGVLALAGNLGDHLRGTDELRHYLTGMLEQLTALEIDPGTRKRATPARLAPALAALRDSLEILPLVEAYDRRKRDLGALDFSDQISLAVRAATAVEGVAERARAEHRVVLLDEFQDTSVAQLDLLRALFGDAHPTMAVGDPQQAIYGWRGASASSLARFRDDFGTAGSAVAVHQLATSWRNDRAILDGANRIAGPLRARSPFPVPQLSPRPGAGPGRVRTARFTDTDAEAARVADLLVERRQVARDAGEAVPSQAMLLRKHAQRDAIERELRRRGLPVEVVGAGGLLDVPEVAELRALLEVADDPARGDAAWHLLAGPRFRLGPADLAALEARARRLGVRLTPEDAADRAGLADALDLLGRPGAAPDPAFTAVGWERLQRLAAVLAEVRAHTFLALGELVAFAERALGLDVDLLSDPSRRPGTARRAVDQLRREAAEYARTALDPTLGAFLARLEVAEDQESGLTLQVAAEDLDPGAVTLLTMHGAKGLEWDHVVLPGWSETQFPSYKAASAKDDGTGRLRIGKPGWLGTLSEGGIPADLRGDAESLPQYDWWEATSQVEAEHLLRDYQFAQGDYELAEERRLAYVAATRAREELYVTTAAWTAGVKNTRDPSRFLREVADAVPGAELAPVDVPAENPLTRVTPTGTFPPPPDRRVAAREAALDSVGRADPVRDLAGTSPALAAALEQVLTERAAPQAPDLAPPSRLSASRVVARARDPRAYALDMLRPVPHAPSRGARRGTGFHAWVEARYGTGSLLDLADLEDFADTGDDEDLAVLQQNFLDSPWARRTPRFVEHPVEIRLGGVTVTGVVDAVFPGGVADPAAEGSVTIVDWKTGRPARGAEKRARERQLAIYRIALSRELDVPPERIEAAFFHAGTGETVRVGRLPGADELAAELAAPLEVPPELPSAE